MIINLVININQYSIIDLKPKNRAKTSNIPGINNPDEFSLVVENLNTEEVVNKTGTLKKVCNLYIRKYFRPKCVLFISQIMCFKISHGHTIHTD